MEYLGHFQHLLCCTPTSQCQGWWSGHLWALCQGGSWQQEPAAELPPGLPEHRSPALLQQLQCLGKLSLGELGWMYPTHCTIQMAGRSHMCQKVGWTVLKEKPKKCRWEAACWNKHIKVVCFQLMWKLYHTFQVNPLGNIIPTRCDQHFSNVWNISFRFLCSLFAVQMLCISQTGVTQTQEMFWDSCVRFFSFFFPQ